MNFTANIGAFASRGAAFLILHEKVTSTFLKTCEYWTYDAYAPRPMVCDMSRNGSSAGRGSSCDSG